MAAPQDEEEMAPALRLWESAANSNQIDGAASFPFEMRF
jgi:hypothetical protein